MQDSFGVRLMKAQNRAGISTTQLAMAIDANLTTISGLRVDRHGCSVERLKAICEVLKCSSDFLLGLSDKPEMK